MADTTGTSTSPKIDISLLQTFYLVAKTGSFSAAARELSISYQSAANHVRRLEQIYGTRLVEAEKGSRQITLTAPGRALHSSLGTELETILSRISMLMRDVHSTLRVGVPQALFHHFFPRVVSAFRAEHSETQLIFYERDTTLEAMMQQGDLDACVSERYFGDPGITQMLLGEYRLALVCPGAWGIDPKEPEGLSALKDRPFITYEPGQTIRSRAQDFLTAAFGEAPNVVASASGSTSMIELAQAGVGYAVVPQWVARTAKENLQCKVLLDLQSVKVYFGCPAFLENDAFVARLREICGDLMLAEFGSEHPQGADNIVSK